MAKFSPADSGYVEVKERVEKFYVTYPNGAIRTNIFEYRDDVVIVGAEVFCDVADDHPRGTGFSQMRIPGGTPFTKDSELENAETSAVGRAIAMAGFEVHRSIASADEIESKIRDDVGSGADSLTDSLKADVRKLAERVYGATWKENLKEHYGVDGRAGYDRLSETAAALIGVLEEKVDDEPKEVDDISF